MRQLAAILFMLPVMALGACKKPADVVDKPTSSAEPAKVGPAAAPVFRDPAALIAAANSHGFQNSRYHASSYPPPDFISTGTLVPLGEGIMPNNVGMYIYGTNDELVDEFRLKLNINEPSDAASAKTKFKEIIDSLFDTLHVEGKAFVAEGLKSERPTKRNLEQLNIELRIEEMSKPNARSLMFIFSRPGAKLQD